MILTGNTLQMSQSAVTQAKAHPTVLYASIGVHPHFTEKEWNEKTAKEIEELAKDPVVVAIGEVGLDFHRNYSQEKAQIEAFTKQVSLSVPLGLFLELVGSAWFLNQSPVISPWQISADNKFNPQLCLPSYNLLSQCCVGSSNMFLDNKLCLKVGFTMWVKHELNYLSSNWALCFLLEEGSINE